MLIVFTSFYALSKIIFLFHPSLSTHSKSPIPSSLIRFVTFCIHEFRGLPFLPFFPFLHILGGHHSKILRGNLFFVHSLHVAIPLQLFVSYII